MEAGRPPDHPGAPQGVQEVILRELNHTLEQFRRLFEARQFPLLCNLIATWRATIANTWPIQGSMPRTVQEQWNTIMGKFHDNAPAEWSRRFHDFRL